MYFTLAGQGAILNSERGKTQKNISGNAEKAVTQIRT